MTDKQRMDYLTLHNREHIAHMNATLREEGLDPTGTESLFLAIDGTTCWGITFREAVDEAMKHDGFAIS